MKVWDESGELEFAIPLKNYRRKLRNKTFLFELSLVGKTKRLFQTPEGSSKSHQKTPKSLKISPKNDHKFECLNYWRLERLPKRCFGGVSYYHRCQRTLDVLGHCGKMEPNYPFFENEIYQRIKEVIQSSMEEIGDDIVTNLISKTAKFMECLSKKKSKLIGYEGLPPIIKSTHQVFYSEHDLYKMFRSVIRNFKNKFLEFKFEVEEFDFDAITSRLMTENVVMRMTKDGQNLYV